MSGRNGFLIKGVGAIVLLWGVIFGVIQIAGGMKPTPKKIAAFVEKNPLDEIEDTEKRKAVIGRIASMLNQLDAEDIEELDQSEPRREAQRKLFSSMSREEQWYFMELRMGRAFSQLMEMFNQMDREERRKTVERALKQMRDNESPGDPDRSFEDADPEMVEKMASAGLEAYFRDASAETKVDLAPLMEEVQNVMSSPNRRRGPGK